MLDTNLVKKIESFVYNKPRSVDEISKLIGKSWRTADRYIKEIDDQFGTISTRVFREGTRGALKIVFWAGVEKASQTVFQKKLEDDILKGKKKEDFSAFDIFQYVPDKNKIVSVDSTKKDYSENISEYTEIIKDTKRQLIIFSGNLSFVNSKNKKQDMFKVLEGLVKKGVSIKVIARVDLPAMANVEKLLSLNFIHGKELVEIRHREQPLRGIITDSKVIRLKEVKEPTGKINELNKTTFIFYTINSKPWAEWLSKIFWKMFSNSYLAQKRLEELKKII